MLVVSQFVVLIALLVGLMGVYAQTRFALNEATGFDKEGLLRVQIPDNNCRSVFVDHVRALPGVANAACFLPPRGRRHRRTGGYSAQVTDGPHDPVQHRA